ncbi:hypothetical protein [Streptomyces sp. S1D4-20]|uniref:hypothetical protein n=1 Tax=Streptomyces sp. S1D4-20 TaxID=2594462 RepID=UPI001164FA17|nr:hypothetical protein [Streptomyces sp. S1D4-20]QDN57357.1 hypothetical protein FNV67_20235 [Streptomyces sp. S1D4-20]
MDEPLDGIDWTDLCDLATALDQDPADPRLHDLRGQRHHGELLTEKKLKAITDIPIPGGTL